VNARVTSENQWQQLRNAEPIDVEAIGNYERELLDRCVSDGKRQFGGVRRRTQPTKLQTKPG
jgi:hypothetical protein